MNKYFKTFGLYAIVFLIILGAVAYTGPGLMGNKSDTATAEAYVYSDLLRELDANNVASVLVSRSTEVSDYGQVEATLKDGSIIIVGCTEYVYLTGKIGRKSRRKRFPYGSWRITEGKFAFLHFADNYYVYFDDYRFLRFI